MCHRIKITSKPKIMLGKAIINPDFRALADYIDKTYTVKTINIIYYTVDNRPTLNICYENKEEEAIFHIKNDVANSYNKKQTKEDYPKV